VTLSHRSILSAEERYKRRALGDKSNLTYELEIIKKTGEKVPVLVSSSPILEGDKIKSILLMIRDISEYKKLQAEKTESELRARIMRIRAMEAERLSHLKTQFINTATHEIRTPLASIQQRIDTGRLVLDKKPISVARLVEDAASEMKPLYEARGQRLVVRCVDAWVHGDPLRLIQVLVNLLGNASKYSPEGSVVELVAEDHGDEVWFMVRDEGVGIKPEDMPRLFKPFPGIRVPGVKDSTGLGLSISKGIVELHGGRIWAESEGPGKGSTFKFTLPKKQKSTKNSKL